MALKKKFDYHERGKNIFFLICLSEHNNFEVNVRSV